MELPLYAARSHVFVFSGVVPVAWKRWKGMTDELSLTIYLFICYLCLLDSHTHSRPSPSLPRRPLC